MISRRDLLISLPLGAGFAAAAALPRLMVGAQQNAWKDPADFDGLIAQLDKIKRLGFAGFETNLRNVQKQFANAGQARKRLEATGLRFIAPHTGIQPDKPEEFERAADGAKALGAERFVLSGSVPKEGADAAIQRTAKALNAAGRYCQKLGMRVIYHNHQSEFVNNGAPIEALLKQTDPDAVFLVFDIGHAFLQKADAAAFITKHNKRVDSLHLRDIKAGKYAPLGQGELDLKAVAAAIRRIGWRGWLIDETEMRTTDSALAERTLASNRKVIRKTFGV